jgi:hypothetical protein
MPKARQAAIAADGGRVVLECRHAETADRLGVVRLLRDAHKAASLPFAFSAAHALSLADRHIADPALLALVAGDTPKAVLLASSQTHPFAPVTYASETVWWISPDARGFVAGEMLAAYEDWATGQGCSFVGMAALASFPRAGSIYLRRGYDQAETHFIKHLAPVAAA